MKEREYVIAFPPYAHICGGIKSGHMLCHMLNERGMKAYVTGSYRNPELNTPSITSLSQEHLRDLQHNGVIVYPDIVAGNPANFTNVVRWWLGASQPQGVNELTFSFSEMHDVATKYENHLFIWYIEDFFIEPPEGTVRNGTCCYAGKGSGIDHSPVVELTGNANNTVNPSGCERIHAGKYSDRRKLAKLFQESEIFYCYDNLCVMMTEARLCGCPVVLMGHWVIPEQDFGKDEFGPDGVHIYNGDNNFDLEKLMSELPAFKERYKLREEKTEKELDKFIELTQTFNEEGKFVENISVHTSPIYGHPELVLWGNR